MSEIHFREVGAMDAMADVVGVCLLMEKIGAENYRFARSCGQRARALYARHPAGARPGDRPVMNAGAIGYGMGKKDFERANCLRAFLGESEGEREAVTKLECNLDDMTGEEIGFAMAQLFRAGALDVYTQAIGMKKSRPVCAHPQSYFEINAENY